MTIQLGDTAPDFTADTTQGQVRLHDYLGDGWGVLFSHPADFTPVCTTELGQFAIRKPDFDDRNRAEQANAPRRRKPHRHYGKLDPPASRPAGRHRRSDRQPGHRSRLSMSEVQVLEPESERPPGTGGVEVSSYRLRDEDYVAANRWAAFSPTSFVAGRMWMPFPEAPQSTRPAGG